MNEATGAGAACGALVVVAVDAGVAEGVPRSEAMRLAGASVRCSAGLWDGAWVVEGVCVGA